MKKISTIIIAMALLFGMAQCKKQETPATPNAEGNEVYITMKVGGGDRHIVYPGTGAVVYGNGDVIYVGDGSKYLGTLSFNDGVFGGTITEPAVGDYLYFYFLGGLTITPSATTTSYTVNIANQSQKLPVLSCGRSSAPYSTSNTTYSSMLENKCALVKFGLTTGTSDAVSVAGMRTGVSIKFNDTENPIVANGTTGSITLKSEGSTEKWAILLPQDAVSGAAVTIGSNSYFTVDVPAIADNGYITSGVNIVPDYVFSVGENTKVHFSSGNLYYSGAEGSGFWGFESTPQNGSYTENVYTNLFNFGANGITTSSDQHNPVVNIYATYDFCNISSGTLSVVNADWGQAVGTLDGHNDWRTLTSEEWTYLFNRNSSWGNATVNEIYGVIILPDNWTLPSGCSFTAENGSGWTTNTPNATQWNAMKAAGAVFLPAAGYRRADDTGVDTGLGGYRSATPSSDAGIAYIVYFNSNSLTAAFPISSSMGLSVRLVR